MIDPLTIAVIATLILCCSAFSKMQGEGDYREIERRKQIPFSKDLDHVRLWLIRAGVCSAFVGTAMLVMRIWGPPPSWSDLLDILYFYGVAYGSFTPVHRLTLNKARGLDWRYVAPFNNYDWWWMCRAGTPWKRAIAITGHMAWYGTNVEYTKDVHRAGAFEYAFECFILALSVFLLILTNNT